MIGCEVCGEKLNPRRLVINEADITISHLAKFKSTVKINYTAVYTCMHCQATKTLNRSRYLSPKEMAQLYETMLAVQ